MGPRPCTGEFLLFDTNCFAGKLAITENASCTFSGGPTFLHWVREVRPADVSWVTVDKRLPSSKKTNRFSFETIQFELFPFFFARNPIVHNGATGLVLQPQSELLPCESDCDQSEC